MSTPVMVCVPPSSSSGGGTVRQCAQEGVSLRSPCVLRERSPREAAAEDTRPVRSADAATGTGLARAAGYLLRADVAGYPLGTQKGRRHP